MGKEIQLGLIGRKLGHSRSPEIFNQFFLNDGYSNSEYHLIEIEQIEDLQQTLSSSFPKLKGFNVTIPFKEEIIPFLHEISPSAKAIGAVNTVIIREGKWFGFNTDFNGFEELFKQVNHPISHAVILGSGGSSKTVKAYLKTKNIPFTIVSRSPQNRQINYSNIHNIPITEYVLIINTTPLGMSPNIDEFVNIPFEIFNESNTLIDLIYNPQKTRLMKQAELLNWNCIGGIKMLEKQAEVAWELFQNF